MKKQAMQFFYGDCELLLKVDDLLSAPVDVIVNSSNPELSHTAGLAHQIKMDAGDSLVHESAQLIQEYGHLEPGMAVYTSAGNLPYKAVIHAVSPQMGEGDEQSKLQLVISRALKLCEINEWTSVAFPALGTGFYGVPVETCAQGFFRAITSFWDARVEPAPAKIVLCLREKHFRHFFDAFREEAMVDTESKAEKQIDVTQDATDEPEAGYVELNEQDISELEDDSINDWFK